MKPKPEPPKCPICGYEMFVSKSTYECNTQRRWVAICHEIDSNHWLEVFGRTRAAAIKAAARRVK
jgi:hypothetical protein